ncbi:MAG: thioesterase family protein [Ignavibacteria bacterium]
MKNFRHKIPIQVRFKDLDDMGHVNNANHLSYIELARLKYFQEVFDIGTNWNKQDGLILARVEIDFRKPVYFNDKVFVYTRCSRIGNKSFDLDFLIVKETLALKNNSSDEIFTEVLAEGKTILACYDYIQKKAIEIPEERKQILNDYEGEIIQNLKN